MNNPIFDIMKPYTELVGKVLQNGISQPERTGTGATSIFGEQIKFDVRHNAPFLTQRHVPLKSTLGELLWFIEGSRDANRLLETYKCNFWEEWKAPNGSIGPMYGSQWRDQNGVDQYWEMVKSLVDNPTSRRMVVSAWDAQYLPLNGYTPSENAQAGQMALAPCHMSFQINATQTSDNTYAVDLLWHQRSSDVMLGLPVNIASYYFLLVIICKYATNISHRLDKNITYTPNQLTCQLGNVHIYNNHIEQAQLLLTRDPLPPATFEIPDDFPIIDANNPEKLWLHGREYQNQLYSFIQGYQHQGKLTLARNI